MVAIVNSTSEELERQQEENDKGENSELESDPLENDAAAIQKSSIIAIKDAEISENNVASASMGNGGGKGHSDDSMETSDGSIQLGPSPANGINESDTVMECEEQDDNDDSKMEDVPQSSLTGVESSVNMATEDDESDYSSDNDLYIDEEKKEVTEDVSAVKITNNKTSTPITFDNVSVFKVPLERSFDIPFTRKHALKNSTPQTSTSSSLISTPQPSTSSGVFASGKKPSWTYKCTQCSELFTTYGQLCKHKQMHITYQCYKCSRICLTKAALKNHLHTCMPGRKKGGKKAMTEVERQKLCNKWKRKYMCSTCKVSYDLSALFMHVKDKHNNYICLHCLSLFATGNELVHHLLETHSLGEIFFPDDEEYQQYSKESFISVCCDCGKVCDDGNIGNHICEASIASTRKIITPTSANIPTSSSVTHTTTTVVTAKPVGCPHCKDDVPARDAAMHIRACGLKAEVEKDLLQEKNSVDGHVYIGHMSNDVVKSPARTASRKSSGDSIDDTTMNDEVIMETDDTANDKTQEDTPAEQTSEAVPEEEIKQDPEVLFRQMLDQTLDNMETKWQELSEKEVKPQTMTVPEVEEVDVVKLCTDMLPLCTDCLYCRHSMLVPIQKFHLVKHLLGNHMWEFNRDDNVIVKKDFVEKLLVYIGKNPDMFKYYLYPRKDDFTFPDIPCECLICLVPLKDQKDLFPHWRKAHRGGYIACPMCNGKFLFPSAVFAHCCRGENSETTNFRYICPICPSDDRVELPGFFSFMVHLRTDHKTCELCLDSVNQLDHLEGHFRKHKLNHFCWKCSIAYTAKPNFMTHLFWKHGTESVECAVCLQKKWPHVYHFCSPPAIFKCDKCPQVFTKAMALNMHGRIHAGDLRHKCTECDKACVSKKALKKHVDFVHAKKDDVTETTTKEDTKEMKEQDKDNIDKQCDEENVTIAENEPVREEEENLPDSDDGKGDKDEEITVDSPKPKKKFDLNDIQGPNLSSDDSDNENDEERENDMIKDTIGKEEMKEGKTDDLESDADIADPKEDADITDAQEDVEKANTKEDSETTVMKEDSETTVMKQDSEITVTKEDSQTTVIKEDSQITVTKADSQTTVTKENSEVTTMKEDSELTMPKDDVEKSKEDLEMANLNRNMEHAYHKIAEETSEKINMLKADINEDLETDKDTENEVEDMDVDNESPKRKIVDELDNQQNEDIKNIETLEEYVIHQVENAMADLKVIQEEHDYCFPPETIERLTGQLPKARLPDSPVKHKTLKPKKQRKRHESTSSSTSSTTSSSTSSSCSCGSNCSCSTSTSTTTESSSESGTSSPVKRKKVLRKKRKKKRSKNIDLSVDSAPVNTSETKENAELNVTDFIEEPEIVEPEITESDLVTEESDSEAKFHKLQLSETFLETAQDSNTKESFDSLAQILKDNEDGSTVVKHDVPGVSKPPKRKVMTSKKSRTSRRRRPLVSNVVQVGKTRNLMPAKSVSSNILNGAVKRKLPEPELSPEYEEFAPPSAKIVRTSLGLKTLLPRSRQEDSVSNSDSEQSDDVVNSDSSEEIETKPNVDSVVEEEEKLYCICQCPYDEVSEMIACDNDDCPTEWFHFECVGIMVPPKGKWYCPSCRNSSNTIGYVD